MVCICITGADNDHTESIKSLYKHIFMFVSVSVSIIMHCLCLIMIM